jgi:hypothetical protein
MVSNEELGDAMVKLVQDMKGKRDLKPMDVTKAMIEQFGEDQVDKKACKSVIRELVDGGRLTYSYRGGSYLEIPPDKA